LQSAREVQGIKEGMSVAIGYITETQTCALIILMSGEEKAAEMFSKETLKAAVKKLQSMGFIYGACEHCGRVWWLTANKCDCKGRLAAPGMGHVWIHRVCVKKLCGNCERLYPPRKLLQIIRDCEREGIELIDIIYRSMR
jgi:hypothetical protein